MNFPCEFEFLELGFDPVGDQAFATDCHPMEQLGVLLVRSVDDE